MDNVQKVSTNQLLLHSSSPQCLLSLVYVQDAIFYTTFNCLPPQAHRCHTGTLPKSYLCFRETPLYLQM